MGCPFFLQGLFLTWESNPCLLLGRWLLYHCNPWEAEDGINLKVKTGWDDGMEKLQLPRDRSLTAIIMTIPTSRGKSRLSTQVKGQKAGAAFTEGSEGRCYQEEGAAEASAGTEAGGRDSSTLPTFTFWNTQISEPNNKCPVCLIIKIQGPKSYYKELQLFNCSMTLNSQEQSNIGHSQWPWSRLACTCVSFGPHTVSKKEEFTFKAWIHHADAFKLWCWRRLLRVSWTARRSKQSIPKGNQPSIFTGRTDAEAPIL